MEEKMNKQVTISTNLSDIVKDAFGGANGEGIHYTYVTPDSGVFCFTAEPLITFVISRRFSVGRDRWFYGLRKTYDGKSVAREFAVIDMTYEEILDKLEEDLGMINMTLPHSKRFHND